MLRSVVPFDEALAAQVRELGTVTSIVAASLQHWLFVPQWKEAFPDAIVYVTPACEYGARTCARSSGRILAATPSSCAT